MERRHIAIYGILALLTALVLGGLIAVTAMGQLRSDLELWRMPEYFWFYRHNGFVMGWLAKGVGGAAALIALMVGMIVLRRRDSLHGSARWARRGEARAAGLMDSEGLLLGRSGSDFIQFGGSEHVLLEAPTRAGKGVGVVIPNLLTWADSVVVLDVKQENWQKSAGWRKQLGHEVWLFDPLDPQGRTARYNPLAHIDRTNPVEVIDELQKIAAMLWPPPSDGESFWMDSARTAFLGVASYIAATPDLPFTMGEVYRNFSAGDAKARFPVIIRQRAANGDPLSEPCVSALSDWISSSANTFTSIRQSVSAKINLWLNPYVDAATSESDFDLRHFRSRPISLYLGVSPDNMERVADIYNLLFQQLIDLNVRELPDPKAGKHPLKLLLLLDEFARMGRANVIASGFSYVAGYGIRLLPVIQARGQLRDVYGEDVTSEIVQNCGVELVFTPKDNRVAREISERLGNYTYEARSRSRRVWEAFEGSVSTSDQRRALVLPQELLLMSQEEVIVLRAGIRPLKGRKIRYYKDRWMRRKSAIAPPVVPARPFDPAIARRSLAVIQQVQGGGGNEGDGTREMSDSEVLKGVAHGELVGFALEDLPDGGDPRKAVGFFQELGLRCKVEDFENVAAAAPGTDAAADAFHMLGQVKRNGG
ncbi:type IV secretion system protein VirD4 [Sphingobium wenxiniae]|jgi:type IV secretion system protein VirD4|uniref:Type IV secretion system protein VirD4 n=1 Tax=Sphingobium wenxiniae (strain DSM 21828 / CGMCC 1.7748 / JZ-1) TaxID=595605 RepID=A0A562K892_SPHWJ|nr:type IV secretory system conjugative DNA transfer family protein [Sphingobium wenxiniae]MBB6193150.1 type IV secretion system protein VirD4 [Sphingobium wenxiniae]MBE5074959.1 type IV secretory system conjugative DNA transfer family protein [Erythrobacteraceae bacterium E2-1 Yellow Sea]TWH91596.1 type IV secretion system protein VirD4 [Sphingobium wenxiniae]